jgi:CheY-like chemotaxis protein
MPSSVVLFRILVVDDERIIADTLAHIFSTAGYDARPAYSAEEALSIIPHWLPQLAIFDVFLPGLNGIELAIIVRDRYADIKILLFSGRAGTINLLEEAQRSGYEFEIMAKPVHPTMLLSTASRILLADENNKTASP